MKALKMTLIFVLIFCLLAGCTGSPAPAASSNPGSSAPAPTQGPTLDHNLPTVSKDYFELLCEDSDAVFRTSSGWNMINVRLISAQKLCTEDIQITTAQNKQIRVNITNEQVCPFSNEHYLCYQGFHWAEYADACLHDQAKANTMLEPYVRGMEQAQVPSLYVYSLDLLREDLFSEYQTGDNTWALPEGTDTVELAELTVTVKGQSKTYYPKKIQLSTQQIKKRDGVNATGAADVRMEPSEQGTFTTVPLRYSAKKEVTLTGFRFFQHPDSQILSCKLKITPPSGPFIEMDWDCKTPIEVDADSQIEATLTFTNPALSGTYGGCGSMYILLAYDRDGEPCETAYHMVYTVFSDAYDYYAWKYDNVDIASYYQDYLKVIQETA